MLGKRIVMTLGLVMISSLSVRAGEIIFDNAPGAQNGDSGAFAYIGQGDYRDHSGGANFDVYSMIVDRSDAGLMTVRINTAFVDISGVQQGRHGSTYTYGDLLMSSMGWDPTGDAADGYMADNANTTGTDWDYVFDLNGARNNVGSFTNSTQARLHQLTEDFDSSDAIMGSHRSNHIYRVDDRSGLGTSYGSGSVEANTAGNYLEFVFDVTGTELATAQQIAFHWTMSCANDVIEGLANFGQTTTTPEPMAAGLLLLGLGGVGYLRRRKTS